MIKQLIIIVLLLFSVSTFSQDILVKKKNILIKSEIINLSKDSVIYKKYNDTTDTTDTVYKVAINEIVGVERPYEYNGSFKNDIPSIDFLLGGVLGFHATIKKRYNVFVGFNTGIYFRDINNFSYVRRANRCKLFYKFKRIVL